MLAPAPTLYGSVNTTTNQNGSSATTTGSTTPRRWCGRPGHPGGTTVDFAAAGLPTGIQYPVRVLATRHGTPIGQASPDVLRGVPDGDQLTGTIEGFTVTGDKALVSTDEFNAGSGRRLRPGPLGHHALRPGHRYRGRPVTEHDR